MNILSLFDGISCGQIALNRAGISYDNYFASEIDKHAIKVAQKNYPSTKQLGDITQIRGSDLPPIFLLLGGSPCQGFSFAGKMLNFDDPRSKLYFEYVRLLEECKPTYFLMENVKMKKECQDIITSSLKVEPIMINSSLVSAQSRKRLYWTNIPTKIPEDKGITLSDVIGQQCISGNERRRDGDRLTEIRKDGKANALLTRKDRSFLVIGAAIRNQVTRDGTKKFLNVRKDNKSNCIVGSFPKRLNGLIDGEFRYLTPLECERLQTIPDNYTNCISEAQRYKAIGNAWTVDVIAHILKGVK